MTEKLNLKSYVLPKSNKTKLYTLPCDSIEGDPSVKNQFLSKSTWQQIQHHQNSHNLGHIETLDNCQSPKFAASQILSQKTNQFTNQNRNCQNRFIGDRKSYKESRKMDDFSKLKTENQRLMSKYEQLRQKYDKLAVASKQQQNGSHITNEQLLKRMKKQSFWKMFLDAEKMLKNQSTDIDTVSFLRQMESLRIQGKSYKKSYQKQKAKLQQKEKQNNRLLLEIQQHKLRQLKQKQQISNISKSIQKQINLKYIQQISVSQKKIAILEEQVRHNKQQNQNDKELINEYKKKYKDLEEKDKLYQQVIQKMKDEDRKAYVEFEKMKEKNHQLQKNISKLQQKTKRQTTSSKEMTSLKSQNESLLKFIHEKEQAMASLKQVNQKLQVTLKDLQHLNSQLQTQNYQLKAMIEKSNKENYSLQTQCKNLNQQKQLEKSKSLNYQSQIKLFQHKIFNLEDSYKQKLMTAQKNFNEVMVLYQQVSNTKTEFQMQIKNLKQALEEKDQVKDKINLQVKNLQKKIVELQQEVQQHQSIIQSAQRQNNHYSQIDKSNGCRSKVLKQGIQRRLYARQESLDYPQKTNKFANLKVYQDTSYRQNNQSTTRRTWSKLKQISSILKSYLNQNRIRSKHFKLEYSQADDCYNISQQMSDKLLNQIQNHILTLFEKLDGYKKDAEITEEVYLEVQDSKKVIQQSIREINLKQEIIKKILRFIPQQYKELMIQFIEQAEKIPSIDPYDYEEGQCQIQEEFNELKQAVEMASNEWLQYIESIQQTVKQLEDQLIRVRKITEKQSRRPKYPIQASHNQTYNRSNERILRNKEKEKSQITKKEIIRQKYSLK